MPKSESTKKNSKISSTGQAPSLSNQSFDFVDSTYLHKVRHSESPSGSSSEVSDGALECMRYIDNSPSPFHCVGASAAMLEKQGFKEVEEKDISPGLDADKFFVRLAGSIAAFQMPKSEIRRFVIAGAHTDSPCLKFTPTGEKVNYGYKQYGVEVYGGAILSSWFDKDLSVAGQVSALNKNGDLESYLIDFVRPIAIIPNLCIHLFREINTERNINPYKECFPILSMESGKGKEKPFEEYIIEGLKEKGVAVEKILATDLFLYDTQPAAVAGLHNEFLNAARLDNQLSCFATLKALSNAKASNDALQCVICNDHEEVGSLSKSGAAGPFFERLLRRLVPDASAYFDAISEGVMVSVDNAHGVHPNYPEKHDSRHFPYLGKGPVIKHNANQRYATNNRSVAIFKQICSKQKIPVQEFVNRSDLACGSTIGPITSGRLGIETLDIGAATFAMHSIREVAGTKDVEYMLSALTGFLEA